jgi:hypothetical protein
MMKMIHKAIMTLVLFTSLASLSACGEDFVPESLLDNTRILAVVTEPIAPGFDDEVSLQPVLHIPEGGKVISESWSFCPITVGSNFGFACVDEGCVSELEGSENPLGSVSAKPGPLLLTCLTDVLANLEGFEGKKEAEEGISPDSEEIPEMLETVFRYTVVVEEEQADGSVTTVERKALTRVNLHFEEPPVNRNPEFESITIDGLELDLSEEDTGLSLKGAKDRVEKCKYGQCDDVIREYSVILKVKESSLDTYFNQAYDKDEIEETEVFWFVTAGRVVQEEKNNLEVEGVWSFTKLSGEQQSDLDGGSLEAWLYAVLRDGEGGQASYGPFKFTVEP